MILASLPLVIVGLLIVIFALLNAAWSPDYEGAAHRNQRVSHWQRLGGDDLPEDRLPDQEFERSSGYRVRRTLDALIYYMVFQAIVAVVGLALLNDRRLLLLLFISSIYGILYAVSMGIVIGPLLTIVGFALVLFSTIFGWLTSENHYSSTMSEKITLNSLEV
jgi:uncharacterized membrane protein